MLFGIEWNTANDWVFAWSILPILLRGLVVTIKATLLGFVVGAALGLVLAGLKSVRVRLISWPARVFTEFLRDTPLLVQLFWMHFALPAVTGLNTTAHQTAGLAIVIVMTAYMAEIYRAGLNTVSRGQHEAGLALGLKPAQRWGLIVIPQAFPIALPAIGNTLVSLLKATAILSILSVPELMRTTSRISDYTANPITFYSLSAVIYIALCLALSYSLHRLETRLSRWRVN